MHNHPRRGPAPGRQLGRRQGDPEARPLAPLHQARAEGPAPDRHRRDLRRQGPPIPESPWTRRAVRWCSSATAGAGPPWSRSGSGCGGARRRSRRWRWTCPPAYHDAVAKNPPGATIVYDHFHVIKLFNDKLSDLRRSLYHEAEDEQKKVLKGSRRLVLEAAENPDPERLTDPSRPCAGDAYAAGTHSCRPAATPAVAQETIRGRGAQSRSTAQAFLASPLCGAAPPKPRSLSVGRSG